MEIQMPVAAGLDAVGELRRQFPDLRIVVCSFDDDPATRAAARPQGADGYLSKPLQIDDLLMFVAAPIAASALADDPPESTATMRGDVHAH